ncbi:MAG: DUF4381 domain-containing protein [Pseudomonadales bacterium]
MKAELNSEAIIDATFGNYTVHGIEEIVFAQAVSWMPSTMAWKILGLLLLVAIGFALMQYVKHWQSNAYRRAALQQLKEIRAAALRTDTSSNEALLKLPTLMKATALQAYPREQVASLSGEGWLKFLDSCYQGKAFSSDGGQALLALSYQTPAHWPASKAQTEELLTLCHRWLVQHRKASDA